MTRRPLLGRGIYDVREMAMIARVHPDQVVRWSNRDRRGRPPAVRPAQGRFFEFVDLVTLSVVAELRRRGVRDDHVRLGVQFLRHQTGIENPLADRLLIESLATSGTSFIWKRQEGWWDVGEGGQGAFDEIIELYVDGLIFGTDGTATAWEPHEFVRVDAEIQGGAPCVAGTRITTAAIAGLLEHASADDVAKEFDLTIDEVEAAANFEHGNSLSAST